MEQLPFTRLLNELFGGPAAGLLHSMGIQVEYPQSPFSNWMAMEILVTIILLVLFAFIRSRISVEKPGAIQHVTEMLHEFIDGQNDDLIGHYGCQFTPYITALFLFILFANLIGLIPTFESPTANVSVPLGLAVLSWFYYHFHGIKKQHHHYFKHFLGPVWWLAWLMLPIELISHAARVLSLTVRLWANIFAGDMITLVFFSLVPLAFPIVFMGLHIFVSFLQAYVFALLASIYLAGAVAEEH